MNVLLIHYSGICSLTFAGKKKKTDITMHKLGNISLSSEVFTCLPSTISFELHNSKVREELSFVFIKVQKFLSVWNALVLLAYPRHYRFFCIDSFRNADMPDYTPLKLFPEIWSSRVRKHYWFDFSKTGKKWLIRNYGIHF